MKCPKCKEEVDHLGLVFHLKKYHNDSLDEMLNLLFEEINKMNKVLTFLMMGKERRTPK